MKFTSETAVANGRRGGLSTSPAKRRTAAKNGQKGGRPRKLGDLLRAIEHAVKDHGAYVPGEDPAWAAEQELGEGGDDGSASCTRTF